MMAEEDMHSGGSLESRRRIEVDTYDNQSIA